MKQKKALLIIIIVTLAFIWGHSMMPPETSSLESKWVMKLVTPFLELFVGKGNVTEHLVRKLAHFCEFTLLGAELMLYFGMPERRMLLRTLNLGLVAALLDETVQIFSGRGAAIPDVWLDFSGVLTGTLITLLGMLIGRRRNKHNQ